MLIHLFHRLTYSILRLLPSVPPWKLCLEVLQSNKRRETDATKGGYLLSGITGPLLD